MNKGHPDEGGGRFPQDPSASIVEHQLQNLRVYIQEQAKRLEDANRVNRELREENYALKFALRKRHPITPTEAEVLWVYNRINGRDSKADRVINFLMDCDNGRGWVPTRSLVHKLDSSGASLTQILRNLHNKGLLDRRPEPGRGRGQSAEWRISDDLLMAIEKDHQ